MNTRISKNLKHLRELKNRPKSWVASELGKRDTTIGDYERGRVLPPLPVLEQYADLFGVYIGDLVGRDLWLSEGSSNMLVEEPRPDYRLVREKEALHGLLDEKEAQLAQLRAEVVALAKRLKTDPAAKDYYLAISEVLAHLEKS